MTGIRFEWDPIKAKRNLRKHSISFEEAASVFSHEFAMKKDELEIPVYTREQLGKGVRGKYFKRYQRGTNLVLLEDEVAQAFPNAEAVNQALRGLLALTRETAELTARPGRRASKARSA
jgi:hypothetical protein